MFHYWMKITNKATRKSKKVADLYLHRSIHDLGVEKEQISIYANKIDLNKYTISFTERQVKQMKIDENTYFKTELGSPVSWYELKTSVEIVYGTRFDYVVTDFNIYILDLIKEGYIKVTPITLLEAYNLALNNGDKVKAIKLYWKFKQKNNKYYSLKSARDHVEKVLEKRNKKGE